MSWASRIAGGLTFLMLAGSLTARLSADEPQATPVHAGAASGTVSQPLSLAGPLLARRQIEQELMAGTRQRMSLNLIEQPLGSLMRHLQSETGIPMRLDVLALDENGILFDEPISGRYDDLALGRILSRCIEPLDLTWVIRNEAVVVTTMDAAFQTHVSRSFNVSDLLKWTEQNLKSPKRDRFGRTDVLAPSRTGLSGVPLRSQAQGKLADVLTLTGPGNWEETDGEGGTISFNGGVVTIRQTSHTLDFAGKLLHLLDHVAARPHAPGMWYVEESGFAAPANRKVVLQLQEKMTVKFEDVPLADAVMFLGDEAGMVVNLDVQSLHDEGIGTDEPINLSMTASFDSILTTMLRDLQLVHLPRDNSLFVTTLVGASDYQVTAVCDIRDLVSSKLVDAESLIDTVMQETNGRWEDLDGEGGVVHEVGGLLLVRQELRTMAEIEVLLHDLRERSPLRAPAVANTNSEPEPNSKPEPDSEPETVDAVTRFYRMQPTQEVDALREAIISFVFPDRWESNGGTGFMQEVGTTLVVRQTPEVHKAIAEFLAELDGKRPTVD